MRTYFYFIFTIIVSIVSSSAIAQLNADFSANKTSGCGSLAGVQFTDLSTGNITSWQWDFGNSNTSVLKNPIASYTSSGRYEVKLVVSDGVSTTNIIKKDFIVVFNNPAADFSFTPSTGCSPLSVDFTNNSTIGDTIIKELKWDFADGSLGSMENPVHEYKTDGTFQPSLEVIDYNSCSNFTTTTNVTINRPPRAAFSSLSSPTSCQDSLLVEFVSNSQGLNLTYEWDFGDNTTSSLPNPTHIYRGLGTYDVRLIAIDPNCRDTIIMKEFVRLEETVADFSLSKRDFCVGEPIVFKNNSSGSAFFNWDFGDGTTTSKKEPVKMYNDSGTYVIKLSVFSGPCLSDTIDTITVHFVKADFAIQRNIICQRSDTTVFFNRSLNADSLIWKLGVADDMIKEFRLSNIPDLRLPYTNLTNIEFRDGYYPDTLIAINQFGCRDTLARDSSRKVDELEIIDILYNTEGKKFYRDTLGRTIVGGCSPLEFDFFGLIKGHMPITTWNWDFGNGTTSSLDTPATVTYNDVLLHRVSLKIENSLQCSDSGSILVQLGTKQSPNFSIFNLGDTLCASDTIFITDLSTDKKKIQNYKYRFLSSEYSSEVNSDTGNAVFRNFPDTGYFSIKQEISSNGCDTSIVKDSLLYVEGPLASFVFNLEGDCFDRRKVRFESKLRGVTRFKWHFGDGTVDSLNDSPVHIYPNETLYQVTLTAYNDSAACDSAKAKAQVDLSRPDIPLIVLDTHKYLLGPKTFCKSDSILYSIINLCAYDSLKWFMNGRLLAEQDSIIIHFDSVGQQIIEARGIDIIGCELSSYDTIYVSDIIAGFDTSIIDCQPFELRFIDTSWTDTTTVNWFWNFGNGRTASVDEVNIQYNTPGDKGVFLRVENVLGCKDSINLESFVNTDLVAISFRTTDPKLCVGDTMVFRNTSQANGVEYRWDFGDGTILDTNIDFVKHQYNEPGMYTVTLSALVGNGCIIEDKQVNLVEVDGIPIAGFFADTLDANCVPFEVGFEDTSRGNIEEWKWQFGDTASSILEEPDHVYATVGEFDVFLRVTTPNGCADSLTKKTYIKITGPIGNFSIDKDTVCVHEPVIFRVLNLENTSSFVWDFGDGNGSTDSVAIHRYDSTGLIKPSLILINTVTNCDIPQLDEIFVFDVLSGFTVSTDSGCTPFSVDFTKQSRGDDAFLWQFGEGSSSLNANPNFIYTQPGIYRVSLEISSDIGCKDTSFMNLVALPSPQLSLSRDTGICIDDSIILHASGGIEYSWTPGQDLIVLNSIADSVIVFPDTTTTYQVAANNEFDCISSEQIELIVQNEPSFSPLEDISLIIGEEFNMDIIAGIGFNYRWRPEEGLSCIDCPNPTAQPLESREYIVDIWDNFGCSFISDTIFIEVEKIFTLDVPSAFSPNGDGVNDIIFAKGYGLKELIAFKIYNRFGELVFESSDFNVGWNGRYRDQDQNIETYIYTVEALTFGGKVLTKKGNISLLR